MKKGLLCAILILASLLAWAQTFPVVITNSNQGNPTNTLNIHEGTVGSSNTTTFVVGQRMVASTTVQFGTQVIGSNNTSTDYWWQVDLPGGNSAEIGFIA